MINDLMQLNPLDQPSFIGYKQIVRFCVSGILILPFCKPQEKDFQ